MNPLRYLVTQFHTPKKLSASSIEAFGFPVPAAQPAARSRSSMTGLALLRRIAACALLLVSFYFARATPAATAAEKPSWQAEWERTLAGAKKEGAVYLWGDAEITHSDIIAAF